MTGMVMIGFMLVAAIVSGSNACSCIWPITFCSGDYAAVIEVKDSGTLVDSNIMYQIRVVQNNIVYHTPSPNRNLDRKTLRLWGVGTSCETQPLSQGYYAITGYLSTTGTAPKAIMSTGGCDMRQPIDNKEEARAFQFQACPLIPVIPIIPPP